MLAMRLIVVDKSLQRTFRVFSWWQNEVAEPSQPSWLGSYLGTELPRIIGEERGVCETVCETGLICISMITQNILGLTLPVKCDLDFKYIFVPALAAVNNDDFRSTAATFELTSSTCRCAIWNVTVHLVSDVNQTIDGPRYMALLTVEDYTCAPIESIKNIRHPYEDKLWTV